MARVTSNSDFHVTIKSDPPKPRKSYSSTGTIILSLLVALLCTGFFVGLRWALSKKPLEPLCTGEACEEYVRLFNDITNHSTNPCIDFHSYVCTVRHGGQPLSGRDYALRAFRTQVLAAIAALERSNAATEPSIAAARLYKSCEDIILKNKSETEDLKMLLDDAGSSWPSLDKKPDLLKLVVRLSLKAKWEMPFKIITSFDAEGNLSIRVTPATNFRKVLKIRDRLVELERYRPHYEILYSALGQNSKRLTSVSFDTLEWLENTSLMTLRRAYVTPPALSSAEVELGDASLINPLLSPERWNETLTAALEEMSEPVMLHIENKAFFDAVFGLIGLKGESHATWLMAWYTVMLVSSVTNSAAIANLHGQYEKAVEAHQDLCFNMAHDAYGYAFYGPHVGALVTPNVLQDVSQMSNRIRSTMGNMAIRAGWVLEDRMASFETSDTQTLYEEVFKSSPLRLQTVFALYANMTSSVTVNWRLAMEGLQDNYVGDVRPESSPEEWYNFVRVATGSHQLTLMPYSMQIPLYHLNVPPSFKYAGLGYQIAAELSTVIFSEEAFDEGKNRKDQLVSVARCIEADQVYRQTNLGDHYSQLLQLIALKTSWRAMRGAQSSPTRSSPILTPQRLLSGLSEAQAFFVLWCYMECGAWMSHQHCNELLRHSEEFSQAFGCRRGEPMASCMVCSLVPGERSSRADEPNLCPQ